MKVVRLAMVLTFMVCLANRPIGVFGQTSGQLEATQYQLSCNSGSSKGFFNFGFGAKRNCSSHYVDPTPPVLPAAPCQNGACPVNDSCCKESCAVANCPCCNRICPFHGAVCTHGCERICQQHGKDCPHDCHQKSVRNCPAHGKDCPNNCPHRQFQDCPIHGKDCGKPKTDQFQCPIHGKDCPQICTQPQFGYGQNMQCPPPGQGPCPIHGHGPCPNWNRPVLAGVRGYLQPVDRPYFGMQPLWTRPVSYYEQGIDPRYPHLKAILSGQPVYMNTSPTPPMQTYTTRGPRDFLAPNPPSIGY